MSTPPSPRAAPSERSRRGPAGLGFAVLVLGALAWRRCAPRPPAASTTAGAGTTARPANEAEVPRARERTSRDAGREAPTRDELPLAPPLRAGGGDGGGPRLDEPSAVWLRARWGGGDNELGRERPLEANAEGPMSLAATRDGRAWVLDQVNNRLLRVGPNGRIDARAALDLRAAQDVAVGDDGRVAVLDRLGDRTVALFDRDGRPRGRVPLGARGGEGGALTGVFVNDEGVLVEREHGPVLRVADAEGSAAPPSPSASDEDESAERPGRPSRDGRSYYSAGLVDAARGLVFLHAADRPGGAHRYTRTLQLGAPLRTLALLDTDRAGVVYLAAVGAFRAANAPGGEPASDDSSAGLALRLVCVEGGEGRPVGSALLPLSEGPEETFRELAALDDGGVLYLRRTAQGASLERYDCR